MDVKEALTLDVSWCASVVKEHSILDADKMEAAWNCMQEALRKLEAQNSTSTNTSSPKFLCNKIKRGSSADFCKYVKYVCGCSGSCPSKRSETSGS